MIGIRVLPAGVANWPEDQRAELIRMLAKTCVVRPQDVVAVDLFCENDGSLTMECHVVDRSLSENLQQWCVDVTTFPKLSSNDVPSMLVDSLFVFGVPVDNHQAFGEAPVTTSAR